MPEAAPITKKQPPKVLALSIISSHTALLQDKLGKVLSTFSTEYFDLLQKAFIKWKQAQHLCNDTGLIPKSAKMEFILQASKEAERAD
eukprot:1705392-Ditylum_brightwellii.AAC.1